MIQVLKDIASYDGGWEYESQYRKGDEDMTLHLLFFTVTVQLRKQTVEEYIQHETAERFREENLLKVIEHRNYI